MNVMNVEKPLHITVVSKDTKKYILDRNLVGVLRVKNPLHAIVVTEYINEHILDRSFVKVINVLKHLHVLIKMKEFIIEINCSVLLCFALSSGIIRKCGHV